MRLTPYARPEQIMSFLLCSVTVGICLYVGATLWRPMQWFAILPAGLFLLILNFFRDPSRSIPEKEGLIVSPADGTITHIDEVDEPSFIGGKAQRVSIFLSIFNVHINRSPVAGKVIFQQYRKGEFVTAMRADSSHLNEANDMGLETDDPRLPKILVRQIAGIAARRIVMDRKEGDVLARGEQYGMIKFGSRTEIFIPLQTSVTWQVKVGDAVQAGSTIVGELT